MRTTALGHAGLMVETADATLLLDPWFSPEGAFLGSWFQYPDNSKVLETLPDRPTAVLISHEHLDHVDPWFLARVPEDVPVIIPRYPSRVLVRKILQGGPREIIEVPQWEVTQIRGDTTVFFVSEPPMNHDSAMVIQANGHALLNMNDARLFPVQLRQIRRQVGGSVDLLGFQGAGASWYPMCYDYPPEVARELSQSKRLAKLAYCARVIGEVEPSVAFPFAGPPAFLDPELFAYNAEMDEGIFPDQRQVADWLAEHGVSGVDVLLPGDAWDVEAASVARDAANEGFWQRDRWEYLEDYAERRREHLEAVVARYPVPSASLWEDFRDYFDRLLGMSPYFNERIGMKVGFEIVGDGGGEWSVDFRPGQEGVRRGIADCGYQYTFDSRWLPPILAGDVPWEDFFLSLRFKAKRDPDLYNDHLLGLLKFATPEALDEVERFESTPKDEELITIRSEGVDYAVSRYCPHAGNDLLETGELRPGGVLVCLAHHYEFDVKTGRCLTGSCDPLVTKRVGEEDPAGDPPAA